MAPDARPMRMVKSILVITGLAAALVGCGADHGGTRADASPTSGLVLDNDTAHAVTLRGCEDCGAGQLVPAGDRRSFALPSNSLRVELDEAGGRTRFLTIMQGVAPDRVTTVKVSDAGAC